MALEADGVEVDWCAVCGGVWLDRGELALLHTDPAAVEAFLAELTPAKSAEHSKRRCPICDKRMTAVQGAWNPSIVLDECPQKDGLWFDKGELTRTLQSGGKTDKVKSFLTGIFNAK